MKRPRPPRRMIIRLIVLLVLGALINVAVAWLIQNRGRGALSAPMSAEDARSALPIDPERDAAQFISATGTAAIARGRASYTLLAFHHEVIADGDIRYADQFMVWHAGWPCHSMHGWTAFGRAPLKTGANGLWRLRRNSPSGTVHVFLPLFPLWPGFAINTVFYAGVLWVMFFAPLRLLRMYRRRRYLRRNLCAACAYPIGSSDVCTECGAALAKPATK